MSNFWLFVLVFSLNTFAFLLTLRILYLLKQLKWPLFIKGILGILIGTIIELGRRFPAAYLQAQAVNPMGDFLSYQFEFDLTIFKHNWPLLALIGFFVGSAMKYPKVSQICPNCNNEFEYKPTEIEGYSIPQSDGKNPEVAKEFKLNCPFCKTLIVIETTEFKVLSYQPEGKDVVRKEDRYKKQEISIIKDTTINFEERKPLIFEERLKKKINLSITNLSSEREKGLITNEEYLQKEKEIVEKCRSELVQQDSKISYDVYRRLASTKQATVERLLETINKDELIILHHNKVKILNNSEWNSIVTGGTAGNSEIIFKSD